MISYNHAALLHTCRGVPIIGTADISAGDMLVFSVSVIGTDSQRSRYSAYAKEHIATKSC